MARNERTVGATNGVLGKLRKHKRGLTRAPANGQTPSARSRRRGRNPIGSFAATHTPSERPDGSGSLVLNCLIDRVS